MSRLMLLGVLRMPMSMVQGDFLSLSQFVDRAHEAADVIDHQDAVVRAAEQLTFLLRTTGGRLDDETMMALHTMEDLLAGLRQGEPLREGTNG